MQARGSSGATLIQLYEQQVEESRRMNANLERIAASLEKARWWTVRAVDGATD
jgi:hypothetical protein